MTIDGTGDGTGDGAAAGVVADRLAPVSRRGLIRAGSLGLVGAALAGPVLAQSPPLPADIGSVEGGRVTFPNWKGPSDRPSPPPPAPMPPGERVGFALCGLGRLTLGELLPAFGECRKARPAALISGTPEKARVVAAQYGIAEDAIYGYDEFDRLAQNPDVRVVYVVTPNGLHRDHTLAAAAAGKHVLCEKPMATSSVEAREMIDACAGAGVKLMIAYRCQYESYNREAIRLFREAGPGAGRFVEATNTQVQGEVDQWRFHRDLAGGGALPDIGLYCLNAARYLTGEEPVEVFGRLFSPPDDPRYAEVEETVGFMLRFPSGVIATGTASYGAHENKDLRIRMRDASIDLENAFAYRGQQLKAARRDGDAEGIETVRLDARNQFALEIDHMATCVLEDRTPRTPGEEGLQDHVLMEAIYQSARTGAPVTLPDIDGLDVTRGPEPEDA